MPHDNYRQSCLISVGRLGLPENLSVTKVRLESEKLYPLPSRERDAGRGLEVCRDAGEGCGESTDATSTFTRFGGGSNRCARRPAGRQRSQQRCSTYEANLPRSPPFGVEARSIGFLSGTAGVPPAFAAKHIAASLEFSNISVS